jgi:hypothetical protein
MSLRDRDQPRIVIDRLPCKQELDQPLLMRPMGPDIVGYSSIDRMKPDCDNIEGLEGLVSAIDQSSLYSNATSVGPFVQVPETSQTKITFVSSFRDLAGALAGKNAGCNIRWSDIIRGASESGVADKLTSFDPSKTIPTSLRVLGTSLGDAEKHCSLEVYDANGKPLFSKYLGKHNGADQCHTMGYPLFLMKKGSHNRMLYNAPKLSDDHKNFWSFDLNTLDKNSEVYRNPSTGEVFRLVKRNSKAAALLDYALSVKNRIIVNPRLLENPTYCSVDDPNVLRIPVKLYTDVYNAYKKKLQIVNDNSYDLSNIKVVLKPLQMSHEMGLIDPAATSGHICLELIAHIPGANCSAKPEALKKASPKFG